MPIENHFLKGPKRINVLGTGSVIRPTRIVLHYTAGSTLSGAISTLRKKGLSYNVLIDINGSVHQARGFNRRAGHAGRSNWKESEGLSNSSTLNADAIGISFVNLGKFGYFSQGRWWYGYKNGKVRQPSIADQDANKLSSIYEPRRKPHWSAYTDEQIASGHRVLSEIIEHYPDIEEIVGHDDIAIDYKPDPGPALPLQEWRKEFGREGSLGLKAKVVVSGDQLNLRDRPIHLDGQVIGTLDHGAEVHIRSVTYSSKNSPATLVKPSGGRALTGWCSVDIDASNTHAGFVYMGYLSRTPLKSSYSSRL